MSNPDSYFRETERSLLIDNERLKARVAELEDMLKDSLASETRLAQEIDDLLAALKELWTQLPAYVDRIPQGTIERMRAAIAAHQGEGT